MQRTRAHSDKCVDGDSGGDDGGTAAFRNILELAHDLRGFAALRQRDDCGHLRLKERRVRVRLGEYED